VKMVFSYKIFTFNEVIVGFPAKLVSFRISRKHETKQVSCFAKQTSCFAKFCFEAKQAVSHVSLFFKRNETARFACFVQFFSNVVLYKEGCRIGAPHFSLFLNNSNKRESVMCRIRSTMAKTMYSM
jgi:hypothetical protein